MEQTLQIILTEFSVGFQTVHHGYMQLDYTIRAIISSEPQL